MKATTGPAQPGITIEKGYTELTPVEFAVWIRLQTVKDSDLIRGRRHLGKLLGFADKKVDTVMHGLKLKGYVAVDPGGPGHPLTFRLLHRLLLVGQDRIIKLSVGGSGSLGLMVSCSRDPPQKRPTPKRWEHGEKYAGSHGHFAGLGKGVWSILGRVRPGSNERDQNYGSRGKITGEIRETMDTPTRNAKLKAKAEPIDWNLDPRARSRLLEVLGRGTRDPVAAELRDELTQAFVRTYLRFRRAHQPGAIVIESEIPNATKAAVLCLQKGVSPEQLVRYWEGRVRDFTRMKFPSLRFLASPGNVDEVACTIVPASPAARDTPTTKGHAYGDAGSLDPRLRPGLIGAGIDLTGYDDRHLLTIQAAARARAAGHRQFVSSSMLPLVEWAAGHLYGK